MRLRIAWMLAIAAVILNLVAPLSLAVSACGATVWGPALTLAAICSVSSIGFGFAAIHGRQGGRKAPWAVVIATAALVAIVPVLWLGTASCLGPWFA